MAILSLLLGIIGAAIVAGLMILADKIGFYLIIVVPIIGGAIIGFFVALPYLGRKKAVVQSGINPTNPGMGLADPVVVRDNRPGRLTLIIVALLSTLVAIAIYWIGSYVVAIYDVYQEDLTAFTQEALADGSASSEAEASALLDEFLVEEVGSPGFIGYLQWFYEDVPFQTYLEIMAEEGISINRTGSSSSGFTLQGTMAYVYWGAEILLMAFLAITTALGRARDLPEPEAPATAAA